MNPLINPSEDYLQYLKLKESCKDEIERAKYFLGIQRAQEYRKRNLERVKAYQRNYNKENLVYTYCNVCNHNINSLHYDAHIITKKHIKNQNVINGAFNISSSTDNEII